MRRLSEVRVCQLCAVDFTLKNFLLPLVDGMLEKGWQVDSVCSSGAAVPILRQRGYRIHTVHIARSMNPLAALRSLLALVSLFRRQRYDILHVHTPVAALIGRLAARLAGIPLVVYTAHGFYFHEGMPRWKYRLFAALERMAGKWTDLLFTQSAEDAQAALLEKIGSVGNVLAIGNGVDVTRFNPSRIGDRVSVRAALNIPSDAYVVGMIGRQVREKGIVEFLHAARELASKRTRLWFLLIGDRLSSDHAAGVDDEFSLAKSVLGERLVAPGLRDDIPEMLNAMDLFCLPSWREGMPRTIIEAMMMAKPVVATNIRGAREEVVNGETGLLVPVRSPADLARAIDRFLIDPAMGRRMGAAGRERALKLYDEANVIALQIEQIEAAARAKGLFA